jgi:endo-1,4-beta-mannosidase
MPIKYHKDYNQFKYDETAQSQAFSEVFKLLTKDIFVNGVIIHEWNDHTDTGFGIVRSDGTPKKAYETIANFFKEWAISGSIEEDDSISQK